MVDDATVGLSGGVVELVDDDVVEGLGVHVVEALGERLDAGQHDLGFEVEAWALDQTDAGVGADAPEHLTGLVEDLISVGDEQHAGEFGPSAVEAGQPRLPQTGGHDYQARAEAGLTGGGQGVERLALHLRGCHGLRRRGDGGQFPAEGARGFQVVVDEGLVEGFTAFVEPQLLERTAHGGEGRGVADGDGPLDAGAQPGSAEVGTADERQGMLGGAAVAPEHVGLGVEGLRAGAVDADGESVAVLVSAREQEFQGALLGDSQVVAGEQADVAAAVEQVVEAGLECVEAGDHDEGDEQVDVGDARVGHGVGQRRAEGMEWGIVQGEQFGGRGFQRGGWRWLRGGRWRRGCCGFAGRFGGWSRWWSCLRCSRGQVVPSRRDHMPHAPARVGHVAVEPRDQVHMQVLHGLAGGVSGVETHVEAVRARDPGQHLRPRGVVEEELTQVVDQFEDGCLLVAAGVPPMGHYSAGDYERVPGGDGEPVEYGEREVVGGEPAVTGDGEEGGVPLVPPDHGTRIAWAQL